MKRLVVMTVALAALTLAPQASANVVLVQKGHRVVDGGCLERVVVRGLNGARLFDHRFHAGESDHVERNGFEVDYEGRRYLEVYASGRDLLVRIHKHC